MVPVFPRVADLKLSVLRLRPHAGVPAGLVVDVTNLLALEVPELRDAVGGQAVMLNSSGPGVVLDEAVATILLMNGAVRCHSTTRDVSWSSGDSRRRENGGVMPSGLHAHWDARTIQTQLHHAGRCGSRTHTLHKQDIDNRCPGMSVRVFV